MTSSIVRLLITAVSFWLVSRLVPGWRIKNECTAIVVAIVYSFLSIGLFMFVWPLALVLLPFLLIPLAGKLVSWLVGFCFTLAVVMLTDRLINDFEIQDMPSAVVGTFILSFIQSFLMHLL